MSGLLLISGVISYTLVTYCRAPFTEGAWPIQAAIPAGVFFTLQLDNLRIKLAQRAARRRMRSRASSNSAVAPKVVAAGNDKKRKKDRKKK
jgi:hypothetical protein